MENPFKQAADAGPQPKLQYEDFSRWYKSNVEVSLKAKGEVISPVELEAVLKEMYESKFKENPPATLEEILAVIPGALLKVRESESWFGEDA